MKCFKPNEHNQPDIVQDHILTKQLLYSGVNDTIEVMRKGFPYKVTVAVTAAPDFIRSAMMLLFGVTDV